MACWQVLENTRRYCRQFSLLQRGAYSALSGWVDGVDEQAAQTVVAWAPAYNLPAFEERCDSGGHCPHCQARTQSADRLVRNVLF